MLDELAQAPRRFVGHAHVAHLAGAHEILQYLQGFGDGHRVFVLHPRMVQIQVVRLQALQAGVQRGGQVLAVQEGLAVADVARALGIAHRPGHLAGQHDVLAAARPGQPGADVGFGQALGFGLGRHGIHLGHVHQVHAALQRVVQLGVRVGLAVLFAPGHGAQADQADIEIGTAEFAVFQGRLRRDWGRARAVAAPVAGWYSRRRNQNLKAAAAPSMPCTSCEARLPAMRCRRSAQNPAAVRRRWRARSKPPSRPALSTGGTFRRRVMGGSMAPKLSTGGLPRATR